jgi:hypothetical protein
VYSALVEFEKLQCCTKLVDVADIAVPWSVWILVSSQRRSHVDSLVVDNIPLASFEFFLMASIGDLASKTD